ncbi:MAG: hypothetical protein JJV89_04280 [Desulfosarcina sp.]|nr:hypothetical protein [Desulfobacterales bacterium]
MSDYRFDLLPEKEVENERNKKEKIHGTTKKMPNKKKGMPNRSLEATRNLSLAGSFCQASDTAIQCLFLQSSIIMKIVGMTIGGCRNSA